MFKRTSKITDSSRASSVIEFLLLFAAVIGVALAFLAPSGIFQNTLNSALSTTSFEMADMGERMLASRDDGEQAGEEWYDNAIGVSGGGPSGSSSGSSSSGSGSGSTGTGGGLGISSGGIGGGSGGGSSSGGAIVRRITISNSGEGGNTGDDIAGVSTSSDSPSTPTEQTLDTDLQDIIALLDGTINGQKYFDLINERKISIVYEDFSGDPSLQGVLGYWLNPVDNTIRMNSRLPEIMPNSAIAAIIAHEAVHADYAWNPEEAIAETLSRHPEITRDDINICRDNTPSDGSITCTTDGSGDEVIFSIEHPTTGETENRVYILNSIDQEYVGFTVAAEVWDEIKGTDTSPSLEFESILNRQGEEVYKSNLRTRGSYSELPEY